MQPDDLVNRALVSREVVTKIPDRIQHVFRKLTAELKSEQVEEVQNLASGVSALRKVLSDIDKHVRAYEASLQKTGEGEPKLPGHANVFIRSHRFLSKGQR